MIAPGREVTSRGGALARPLAATGMTWFHPAQVRLVVELLWPLFLFLILVWVRTTSQPFHKGQCKYRPPGRRQDAAAALLPLSLTCLCRSLPQQGHALGRNAALAPGSDLQHGEPVSEPPHAGGDAGPSQQLQQLHVAAHAPAHRPSTPAPFNRLWLTADWPAC